MGAGAASALGVGPLRLDVSGVIGGADFLGFRPALEGKHDGAETHAHLSPGKVRGSTTSVNRAPWKAQREGFDIEQQVPCLVNRSGASNAF